MDFIQSSNKQVDKFGPGKHGFSAGNPSGGVAATFMSPEWCDNVQQELINVIEAAGIAPAAATRNQLLLALRSAGVFTTPAAGDRTTKVATTAMFGTEFTSSLLPSGWQKLPSGLIIQWGAITAAIGGGTHSFTIAFPNVCLAIWGVDSASDLTGSAYRGRIGVSVGASKTQFGFAGEDSCFWFAIGY